MHAPTDVATVKAICLVDMPCRGVYSELDPARSILFRAFFQRLQRRKQERNLPGEDLVLFVEFINRFTAVDVEVFPVSQGRETSLELDMAEVPKSIAAKLVKQLLCSHPFQSVRSVQRLRNISQQQIGMHATQ